MPFLSISYFRQLHDEGFISQDKDLQNLMKNMLMKDEQKNNVHFLSVFCLWPVFLNLRLPLKAALRTLDKLTTFREGIF